MRPAQAHADRTRIVVLGMHRSGTALVTGLLRLLGAESGAAREHVPPGRFNPKGTGQRRDVANVNQLLLDAAAADWHRVGGFEPGRVPASALQEALPAARAIVEGLDVPLAVLADPRFCLLLPFWQALLGNPLCVIVHRHPAEVSRSLQARDGFSRELGVALWERYTLDALRWSRALPRCLCAADQAWRNPMATLGALRAWLDARGVPGLREATPEEVAGWVDPDLRHHAEGNALEPDLFEPGQSDLWAALESGAALEWKEFPEPSERTRSVLAEHERFLGDDGTPGPDGGPRRASGWRARPLVVPWPRP